MIVDWAGSVCSGITLSEHIVDDSVVPSSTRFTCNPNDFHCSSVTSRHGLNAGWLCCSGLNFPNLQRLTNRAASKGILLPRIGGFGIGAGIAAV